MTNTRLWKTRLDGTEYGPYTTEEMLSYVTQQRIGFDTEAQHPHLTQGLWLTAKNVKILREKLDESAIPPVQSPVKKNIEAIAEVMRQPVHQARPSRRTRRNPLGIVVGLIILACVAMAAIYATTDVGQAIGLSQSPEQRLIRAYLKQETPTGKWTEISWSKSYASTGAPVTRLDFRTENPFGGTTKSHLSARYFADSNTVFMEGFGVHHHQWLDPESLGLPPVSETRVVNDDRQDKPSILHQLADQANERMSKRKLNVK